MVKTCCFMVDSYCLSLAWPTSRGGRGSPEVAEGWVERVRSGEGAVPRASLREAGRTDMRLWYPAISLGLGLVCSSVGWAAAAGTKQQPLVVAGLFDRADGEKPSGDNSRIGKARKKVKARRKRRLFVQRPIGSPWKSLPSRPACIGFNRRLILTRSNGATYDATTQTLSLFGHRRHADRLSKVPYLDLLASALESDSPIFSLEWTASSRRTWTWRRSGTTPMPATWT